MSFGKARAAVPACAVVAGVQCGPPCGGRAGLGANLARRGRFRGRWRAFGGGWCNTLAACLGARWRPFCGPCGWWLSCGLSLPLAWPLRAARGWRWRGLDWWRVVLAAVAVWAAPVAAVAVAGASIKRARRVAALGGPLAALRWWRGQIVKERARLALLALSLVWWPWRESNPRRRWRSPMVAALALSGRGV